MTNNRHKTAYDIRMATRTEEALFVVQHPYLGEEDYRSFEFLAREAALAGTFNVATSLDISRKVLKAYKARKENPVLATIDGPCSD